MSNGFTRLRLFTYDSKEVNTSTTLSVKFSGSRIRTKLYRAGNGLLIHADVNGSLNILRKVVPTAFSLGIEKPLRCGGYPRCSKWRGVVVRPVGVIPGKRKA